MKLKLSFCGGTDAVTGANFLLENETTKILIDCGLEQGDKMAHEFNQSPFPYDPKTIDVLLITHSHIDHVGKIPKLVRNGFKGVIYSTPETKELSVLMLNDSVKLLMQETRKEGVPDMYNEEDVKRTFELWQTIPYHTKKEIASGFEVYLKDAGHVLGSCMYEIMYNGKKIVFTGDLGNSPTPLLRNTENITDADYIVMESVYGDRNHEEVEERLNKLENIIEDSIKRKGALVIPSFSLEKTQVILYEMNKLVEAGRVPVVPVYIDSPLAIKITKVYEKYTSEFNETAKAAIKKGDDIFNFPNLHFTETSEESKAILHVPSPKIIIAGSGMSSGGRVLHHELNYLSDHKNTLLLVGYQSVGTMGRMIQDGAKQVSVYGQQVPVNAKVEHIDGYSSHKDSDHLVEFVSHDADVAKKIFVVMGEPKSSLFLVQRLRDYLGVDAVHPLQGSSVELEF